MILPSPTGQEKYRFSGPKWDQKILDNSLFKQLSLHLTLFRIFHRNRSQSVAKITNSLNTWVEFAMSSVELLSD